MNFRLLGWAAMFVALTATGCLFSPDDKPDPPPTPPREELAPTSPENVLENFITAHVNQDIAMYRRAIADAYEFRSTETGFEPLNKTSDEEIMTRMFDEVLSIEARLVNAGAIESDLVDEFPPEEGFMMIRIPAVRLEVATTRDQGAGPITYLVDGDIALFVFEETSPNVWQIRMQEDQGTGG